MSSSVWKDEGAPVNFAKLEPYQLDRIYVSARQATLAELTEIRKARPERPYVAGLYRCTSWDVQLDPLRWARMLNADWASLKGAQLWLPVQVNIEKEHGLDWLVAFLREWRRLRPGLDTSWAFEGFQGGFYAPIREEIAASRVRLAPETYGGNMETQRWDPWAVAANLIAYDFPASAIDLFLDGKRVDPTLRGWSDRCFIFTEQRLA